MLKPGPQPEKNKMPETISAVIFVAFIVAVAAGGFFVYHKYHHTNNSTSNNSGKNSSNKLASAADEQNRYQAAINNTLKSGNYQSYQLSELELANGYITAKNYNAANGILQTIQKNVPQNKISSYYYQLKVQIDEQNKDTIAQKDDLQTLIKLLKATGQAGEAPYYQKQLDNL